MVFITSTTGRRWWVGVAVAPYPPYGNLREEAFDRINMIFRMKKIGTAINPVHPVKRTMVVGSKCEFDLNGGSLRSTARHPTRRFASQPKTDRPT
jgi:hypothetical protein